MTARFKTYSTPYIIRNDTLEIPKAVNLDSIKKLIPIGFYLLTEKGARKSIKASIDADAYYQKWQITDAALGKTTDKLSLVSSKLNYQLDINLKNDLVISGLKKKLLWANIWKWTAIGASVYLTREVLIK